MDRPRLAPTDTFFSRHVGSSPEEVQAMLETLGYSTLEELLEATVPASIRLGQSLNLPPARSESQASAQLRRIMGENQVLRSLIGQGYYGTITPPVLQRNILENPGWYTGYTPYQAEISQGRLEALLNFQTMIMDLTGMEIANASLLDEGTAAAEAMTLCHGQRKNEAARRFLISDRCHPQTIDVVRTRALPLGWEVVVAAADTWIVDETVFGVLLQYPDTYGAVVDYTTIITQAHEQGALAVLAADPLALTLLKSPGELEADVAVGSTQRFGVPLGYGGPHAAYLATRNAFKRDLPGRLVGISRDAQGRPALRLSLQTREQHIRRDKATSNICTAQVLLAVMAVMYASYHGPQGLKAIAQRVHDLTRVLALGLHRIGATLLTDKFFDTLAVRVKSADEVLKQAVGLGFNLRKIDATTVGVSVDETVTAEEVEVLLQAFNRGRHVPLRADMLLTEVTEALPASLRRTTVFLQNAVFNKHHTETEMLRYLKRLEMKDLTLTTSMIPLGSCTMKLNAAVEMYPVTWPEVGQMHPFAPLDQAKGYQKLFSDLEQWLAEITGFAAVSLQPNAGSQGELAGLLAIREYHLAQGENHRTVCLIPVSAHGTNPASAVMAGFRVVPVACDSQGNIDLGDLRAKAEAHAPDLAAIMVTYPSTHGVFEESILELCEVVHRHGGQVYLDGANLNAQVGMCRPGDFGADVCHLNLHKTFCIPHGGGGPGVGPIGVAEHLRPYLPGHTVVDPSSRGTRSSVQGAIAAAPWGSASILVISWMYIAMLGPEGLRLSTAMAILNANYIARQLENHFPVLYRGQNNRVAHECIIDLREWKAKAGLEVEDAAKRLMDFGFHAPTMSWPVAGTLMVEPTESESKEELDRFCEAMIAIHGEMMAVQQGRWPRDNNPLKHAPHTAEVVLSDEWSRPYSRELAAYPAPWTRAHKFWPAVSRIDNVYGDRNLVCSCVGMEAYA
jgi:glycine dehydrogenase